MLLEYQYQYTVHIITHAFGHSAVAIDTLTGGATSVQEN